MDNTSIDEDFVILEDDLASTVTLSSEEDELSKSWLSSLSSLVVGGSVTTRDFVTRITTGIQLATKAAANEKIEKNRIFEHTLHIFEGTGKVMPNVKEFFTGAFKDLRENLYLISPEEYIEEWSLSEDQLHASEGAGRSGSLFSFSRSKKYIMKTIFKAEVDSMTSMMKRYYRYCHEQPNTLIMRILGLYCFSDDSIAANFTFVLVFGNIMWSGVEKPLKVHQVFDLKGRRTKTLKFHEENIEEGEKGVMKDKNLNRLFYIGDYRRRLLQQLSHDVDLLKHHNLMDYSLLIGVHHCNEEEDGVIEPTPTDPACMGSSLFRQYRGGFPANGEIYFVGIIDCLTYYGAMKMIAHSFKSILWNKEQLSTVQANFYAERFLQYMGAIFPEGEKPSISPFSPCAATAEEAHLTTLLNGLYSVLVDHPTKPCRNRKEDEFRNQVVHQLSMSSPSGEAISLNIKEYAPSIFSYLRKEWHCDTKQLAEDLRVPILQLQANRINKYAENGHVIGTSIPSTSKKYVVDIVSQRDVHTFFTFLQSYTEYILEYPDSLLCRVVGIFRCSFSLISRVYVIVMENPEYTSESIPMIASRIYMMQGAKAKQPTPPLRDAGPSTRPVIFFDRNVDRTFSMGSQKDGLVKILQRDAEFLKKNLMISYSLVIVVGRLVVPDKESLNIELVEKEKRGLVESAFGQWVLLAGIFDIWRSFGRRNQISTSLPVLWGSTLDPSSFCERFCDMLETRLTK